MIVLFSLLAFLFLYKISSVGFGFCFVSHQQKILQIIIIIIINTTDQELCSNEIMGSKFGTLGVKSDIAAAAAVAAG